MNAPTMYPIAADDPVKAAIESAIDSIAPNWPLDRMIAVNPYWGRIHQSFEEAGRALAKHAGSILSLPPAYYRHAWHRGEISFASLQQAAAELRSAITPEGLI